MHAYLVNTQGSDSPTVPLSQLLGESFGLVLAVQSLALPQDPEIGVGKGVAGNFGFCTFQKLPRRWVL